jgi:general secretion pathway protein B
MSYILDALKRADAERERGHVPGLHTRTTPELDTSAAETGGFGRRKRLMALAALLALGAVLWWWLRVAPPAAPTLAAVAPAVPAPVVPSNPTPPSAPVQPPEPAGSSDLTIRTAPPVLPILAPSPPPAPAKAAVSLPAGPTADAQRATSKTADVEATQKSASPPDGTTSTAAATTVPSFAELSSEARARLPAVNISGSTYSKNPALRMLIANGKVVQEGGEIAPGLTLETIAQRSAVLNHQGLRYRIGY